VKACGERNKVPHRGVDQRRFEKDAPVDEAQGEQMGSRLAKVYLEWQRDFELWRLLHFFLESLGRKGD
jgi:hypothetical protein